MYLRDLSIHAGHNAKIPKDHSSKEFNFSTHAVQEIFLTFMPRKYFLDGTGKTNLVLGPDLAWGPTGGYPQYRHLTDVNMYFVEGFDFRAYFAASVQERDEMLLSVLERSLLDIASRFDADPKPIQMAIDQMRACGCERRYVISRLSKLTRSRRLKLNVFRHIFHGGESWGIDITNRKGQVLQTRWIAKRTDWFQASYDYRRSILQGENFVVLDWVGRQSYKLNVARVEAKLIGERG